MSLKYNQIILLTTFLLLTGCAWQNETIKSYNENYACQIENSYFTKVYKNEDITIKDELAYDKENKPITGVAVRLMGEGDIKVCLTKYFQNGKRTKNRDIITISDRTKWISEDIYEKNGIIKHYKNGEYVDYSKTDEDGKYVIYYPNGQVKSEYTLADDKAEYFRTDYYPNGVIETIINYKDNKENGYTYNYDEQGMLTSKEYYKNGKREGKSYSYYPSGKIENIGNYKQDKPIGKHIYYYENGHKNFEMTYKNGLANGVLKGYWENGNLLMSETYVNGIVHGPLAFYDAIDGNLTKYLNVVKGKAISGYQIDSKGKRKAMSQEELKSFNYVMFSNNEYISNYKKYNEIRSYNVEDYLYRTESSSENMLNFNNNKEISHEKFNKMKQALDKNVNKFKAKNGSFIVMDASDATILATYTTKEKGLDDTIPWMVRFYEPGSVLKAYTMAMALESKKFTIKDKIDASQPLKLRYNVIRDYRGENRELSMDEVLVYSSNIASAKMALAVGGEYQYNFLKKMGLLDKIDDYGIKIPTPIYPDPKKWYNSEASTATIGYGYGLSTSPLHLITAYSALINGGVYHKPSFEHVDNKEGVRVISNKNSEQMKKFLRLVVVKGSARRTNIENVEIMGKTGTAQKLNENGRYEDGKVMATFVGNFEHNNKQYAILVILDEPQPIAETHNFNTSGWNAVPTAGDLIQEITKRQ